MPDYGRQNGRITFLGGLLIFTYILLQPVQQPLSAAGTFPWSALFMCDVVCWDCPFLFLPVPAQFKDRYFLKAFLQWKKYISPFTHPPISLSVSRASVVLFYALIPFGPGYITIAPLLHSSPQEIDTLEEEAICHSRVCPSPTPAHPSTCRRESEEMLKKCAASALNRILAWLSDGDCGTFQSWDLSRSFLWFFVVVAVLFVLFLFLLYLYNLSLFFPWEHLDHSFLSSGSLSLFFLEICRAACEKEKCDSFQPMVYLSSWNMRV